MVQVSEILASGVGIVFVIIGYIITAISLMVIAKKEGLDNGWYAWIPILNLVLMVDIAGVDTWMILLFFIPIVNLFFMAYIWWQIAEARGKPGAIGLLILIPIIDLFIPPYLAFTD